MVEILNNTEKYIITKLNEKEYLVEYYEMHNDKWIQLYKNTYPKHYVEYMWL